MLPANQLAGFGDLSFKSHSHSISYFNSAQTPISYPNPTKFELQLRDRSGEGEDEEDEWAVYASNRVAPRENIGTRDLQAGPTQKADDSVDDWGSFVSSPLGVSSNHIIKPGISSGKLHNGGLQVGPSQNGEDWGVFMSSPGASQLKANGSNPVSSNISSTFNQMNNGGLQAGLVRNEGWGLFSSFTGTTELAPTRQASDQNDRVDKIQVNPSRESMIPEEEEDEWGNFVSTPVASPANNNDSNDTRASLYNENSQRKLGSVNLHVRPINFEEEWGEFVSSPVASGTKTSIGSSSSASPSLKWEKPKGPIPLSFFGGEEEELEQEETKLDTLPNLGPVSVSHSNSFSNASPSISSQVPKEIILNNHGGNENLEERNAFSHKINGNDFDQEVITTNGSKNLTSHIGSTGGKAECATRWNPFTNGENGVVEEAWEFKDASSDITSSLTASPLKEDSTNSWASFSPLDKQAVSSSAIKLKDDLLSLHTDPDLFGKKASSPGLPSNSKMAVDETDQRSSSESTIYLVLKFYKKLQEGSLLLISHHIKGHKEASRAMSFVGQSYDDKRLDKEIQEAYRELKNLNLNASEVLNSENGSRDACINELLTSTEELYLKNFEREYQLSTKILLAVEKLTAALDLLKQSLSTVNVLEMASMEGISVHISIWYSLISVCSEELKHGASIWAQSSSANLSDKLISSGENYFIALGEIYRVVEILKLSLKRFSLLLLLSNQNRLNELDVCLDICTKAWTSGLDVALETISNGSTASALNAKSLTGSIKRIREVNFQNDDLYKEKRVCKLCLLPFSLLPGMKPVIWHGDQYIMKLVNLWVNKISPEPPKLPSIQIK